MRFLADAGISPKTVEFLRRRGHDAIHVRELAMQRAADRLAAPADPLRFPHAASWTTIEGTATGS
jgi:hypothetical protein